MRGFYCKTALRENLGGKIMSIADLEKIDLGSGYYNLNNKLWEYVLLRSEDAFKKAKQRRSLITSKEELSLYAEKMRKLFIESLGGIPYDKNLPLNAKTVGVIEENDLIIEKVIFESRPKIYVTANLYIPKKRKDTCGAVLFQIGHAANGKACEQYQRVARAISSTGLIVLIMDPVGQGERLSYFEPSVGDAIIPATVLDHQYAGEQCVLVGDSVARYFIADAMRAVDYLQSRPEVDSEKIGATGSSGGGTATCHAMICDPRIKAAAPGTFVTTRRDYLYAGGAQDSEQIWHGMTEKGFDHHEFLLCFAPKPVMLLTVDSDFFPIEGADEVLKISKRFYKMYDCEDNLKMVKDSSQHKYTDTLALAAASFFALHLNGEKKEADINALKSIPEKNLLCTQSGQVKLEFSDSKFVFDENLERLKFLAKPKSELKEFLTEKMNYKREKAELKLRTFSEEYECGLKVVPYMWFSQKQLPNFGLRFTAFDKNAKDTVILLWDKGTDNLEEHIYKIREIVKKGQAAFVIDLSGIGKCKPNALNTRKADKDFYGVLDRLTKDLFFLEDSLCAIRLFELEYAVNMIKSTFGGKVSIYAEGVSAMYAKLFKEIHKDTETETVNSVPYYDEIVKTKYYENYNIAGVLMPGIAKYFKN